MIKNKQPRSLLFIPAIKIQKYAQKLNILETDGIIFDLEDSVGEGYKEVARNELRKYLQVSKPKQDVYIRINSSKTLHYNEDISLILELQPDVLMLSKVETAEEIIELEKRLDEYELKTGKRIYIFIVIETLKGYYNRDQILMASRKCALFAIGYEDLSAELGIERPNLNDNTPLNRILIDSIISAKLRGIQIIDAVSRKFKIEALEELEIETRYGQSIGLWGKVAIHPNQLATINKVYDLNEKTKKCVEILDKFNKITDGSSVIINDSGEMEDTPSEKLARKFLEMKK